MEEAVLTSLPEQHIAEDPSLWRRACTAGALAIGSAGMVVTGAFIGTQVPATAEIGPGLSADATLAFDKTTIDLGALGSISLPHATGPAGLGANLEVHGVSVDYKDPDTLSAYAAIRKDPRQAVLEPIVGGIVRHGIEGAATGLAVDALALGFLARRRNMAQASNKETDMLPFSGRAIVAGTVVGSLVLGGTNAAAVELNKVPQTGMREPISLKIIDGVPALQNATVDGSGAQWLINVGAKEVVKYIDTTNDFYKKANQNLAKAFANLEVGKHDINVNDPNYKKVLTISDYHCNVAAAENMFGKIAKYGNVDVVANEGDTNFSAANESIQSRCTDSLAEALQPKKASDPVIKIATVMGNHDYSGTADHARQLELTDANGKKYKPFVVLDKQTPWKDVGGVLFASGKNDPRSSVFGTELQPADRTEQKQLLQKQGETIAQNACTAQADTGKRPIALAHDPTAVYAAIVSNCVSAAWTGHLHHQEGPFTYKNLVSHEGGKPSYTTVDVFTQGSSSGAGPNAITEYSPVTAEAGGTYTIFLVDPVTNEPKGYYNIIISKDASVELTYKTVPKAKDLPAEIPEWLATNTVN